MINMRAHRSVTSMLSLLLVGLPVILAAQPQVAILDYQRNSRPFGIAMGPDGAMWFADGNGKIGRITIAGAITEFPVPSANSSPQGITRGSDGALWFTDTGTSSVGRITTEGVITEYPVPEAISVLGPIAPGPQGASELWFTESADNQIGRITTAGVITQYHVPTLNSEPESITAGPDGAMWFTEARGNNIGRIAAGAITEYPVGAVLGGEAGPLGIAAGPDGALWFTESYGSYGGYNIGRMTTAGAITWYFLASSSFADNQITVGPDGALWFTMYGGAIGRITTAGAITEYGTAYLPGIGGGIAAGPNFLWFTASACGVGVLSEVVFVNASLAAVPSSGVVGTSLTFTGSGFAPNENVAIFTNGVGSAVLAAATADASGSFTATAAAPPWSNGQRFFIGVGQSSGKLGAASFSVNASLVINPSQGSVGSTAVVQGYGFLPGNTVNMFWLDPQTSLGAATPDADGSFIGSSALTFTVPAGAPVGLNEVGGRAKTPCGQYTDVVGRFLVQ